jgi:L-ascorbate metabolism protein UlaG (beta-lactamase superfamily)
MNSLKSTFLVIIIFFTGLSAKGQKATYIANSGVLIEYNGNKVIIDALFENGKGRFVTPEDHHINKITGGKAPFDKVKLALFTHSHHDHFDGALGVELLSIQKNMKMITTPQVIDTMKNVAADFSSLEKQVITYPTTGSWKYFDGGELRVKSAYSRHSGKSNARNMNLIFLIYLNSKKVLHLGDADMNLDRFKQLRLSSENIDVAFVPFWYLTGLYGAEIVAKYINAKKIVAVHVPHTISAETIAKMKSYLPNLVVFTKQGQTTTF